MTARTDDVTITAPIVPTLRCGLRRDLSAKLETLQVQVVEDLIPESWTEALAGFTDGCDLLEEIGLTDNPGQADLQLDVCRWGTLALKVLEVEYQEGVERIQEAKRRGHYNVSMIGHNVPALGAVVKELQQRTGTKPQRGRGMSFLETQLGQRRIGRRRGDS